MPKISYAKLIQSWEKLNRSLATEPSEPLIELRRGELEAALIEVKERLRQQEVLLGQAATNTRLLRAAVAQGKETEARIRALLKGAYGRKSKQLLRFGLRPQRKRRSSTPVVTAGAAASPAAAGAVTPRKPKGPAPGLSLVRPAEADATESGPPPKRRPPVGRRPEPKGRPPRRPA